MKIRRVVEGVARTVRRLGDLSWTERRQYLVAWWILLTCRLRLRFPRMLRGRRLVMQALEGRDSDIDSCLTKKELDCFRHAADDHVFRSNCLPRALALHRFLKWNGHPARVEMGMMRVERGLLGHIWVVHGRRIVGNTQEYVAAFRILQRGSGRLEVSSCVKGITGEA